MGTAKRGTVINYVFAGALCAIGITPRATAKLGVHGLERLTSKIPGVIGGGESSIPSVVSLSTDQGSCTATVIGKTKDKRGIFSTAGHCMVPRGQLSKAKYTVSFTTADGKTGKATCQPHPNYTHYDAADDMALCTSEIPIPNTPEACLERAPSSGSVSVVGHGRHIIGQTSDRKQRRGDADIDSTGDRITTSWSGSFVGSGDSGGFMGRIPARGPARIYGIAIESRHAEPTKTYGFANVNGVLTQVLISSGPVTTGRTIAHSLTSAQSLQVMRDYLAKIPGAEICNLDPGGVTVSRLEAGSLASELGLAAGDRILSVNGKPTTSVRDLSAILAKEKGNAAVSRLALKVDRADGSGIEIVSVPIRGNTVEQRLAFTMGIYPVDKEPNVSERKARRVVASRTVVPDPQVKKEAVRPEPAKAPVAKVTPPEKVTPPVAQKVPSAPVEKPLPPVASKPNPPAEARPEQGLAYRGTHTPYEAHVGTLSPGVYRFTDTGKYWRYTTSGSWTSVPSDWKP